MLLWHFTSYLRFQNQNNGVPILRIESDSQADCCSSCWTQSQSIEPNWGSQFWLPLFYASCRESVFPGKHCHWVSQDFLCGGFISYEVISMHVLHYHVSPQRPRTTEYHQTYCQTCTLLKIATQMCMEMTQDITNNPKRKPEHSSSAEPLCVKLYPVLNPCAVRACLVGPSVFAKQARGMMVRYICQHMVDSPDKLKGTLSTGNKLEIYFWCHIFCNPTWIDKLYSDVELICAYRWSDRAHHDVCF